jgi:uncharacterized damage-inducible protein DinB
MDQNQIIRDHLLSLLQGGNAHAKFDDIVKDFPMSEINTRVTNVPYSSWQLLEHIRRTQHDILDFIINSNYKELEWPKDYWPSNDKKAIEKDWKQSIEMFNTDSKELEKIVKNPKTDLYAKIPHGDGQTILREILLVADHNAYHMGELVMLQRVMGIWDKKHK